VVTDRITPHASASDLDPASIEIRPLASHEERAACVALQRSTWGEGFTDVIPSSILKVSQRIGGVAVGAFDQDGALVGFVFGLTGIERGQIVHWSDMLAVAPRARNLGLGRRLKEHQRKVVRQMGGDVIYWTYDPLIARNAHLNFNRLGVRLAEYVEDMYGITDSALHGGLPTDRVIVAWPTHDHEIDERRAEAERAATSDWQLAPVVTTGWMDEVADTAILPYRVLVETPMNGEALLLGGSSQALRWRESVRRAMQWGLAAGYSVVAFLHDAESDRGYYLLNKEPRTPSAVSRT
jgi:predicted GNAT superfamily acetyltransferase